MRLSFEYMTEIMGIHRETVAVRNENLLSKISKKYSFYFIFQIQLKKKQKKPDNIHLEFQMQ